MLPAKDVSSDCKFRIFSRGRPWFRSFPVLHGHKLPRGQARGPLPGVWRLLDVTVLEETGRSV